MNYKVIKRLKLSQEAIENGMPIISAPGPQGQERVILIGDFDVDVDGIGDSHGDPDYAPDTSLHYEGKPLNSDIIPFMVVPIGIPQLVKGLVLGCQGLCTNLINGHCEPVVVGDLGPTYKVGEGSRILALRLDINPSPVNGGMDDFMCVYEFFPGIPAVVDGRQFQLQPYKG